MTYEQIAELADESPADNDADRDVAADGQLSFDDEKKNPYAD